MGGLERGGWQMGELDRNMKIRKELKGGVGAEEDKGEGK